MNGALLFRAVAFAALVSGAACSLLWSGGPQHGVSSSLVSYLYPDGQRPALAETVPHLELPLRVGVAFVPATLAGPGGLSEARKTELLDKAKASFADRDYISTIEVIPDSYLRGGRGFETVEQVARLYDLDVVALVSYDQVAVADDTRASLLYWTIVGAYFIEGSKQDVQTFVDTAVFDVNTRALLFRAPGTNMLSSRSTLISSPEEMRRQRSRSFELAMEDMTTNLDGALETFRERIRTDQVATVSHRPGYGTGSVDLLLLLALAGVALLARRT